jgi:hypothetical protein
MRASNAREDTDTSGISPFTGATAVTTRGITAPIAKLPADDSAA